MQQVATDKLVYPIPEEYIARGIYDFDNNYNIVQGPIVGLSRYSGNTNYISSATDRYGSRIVQIVHGDSSGSSAAIYKTTSTGYKLVAQITLDNIGAVAMSGDGNYVAVALADAINIYWRSQDLELDTEEWSMVYTVPHSLGANPLMRFSHTASILAIGSPSSQTYIEVWVRSGHTFTLSQSVESPDSDAKFGAVLELSGDGSTLFISTADAANGDNLYVYISVSGTFSLTNTITIAGLGIDADAFLNLSVGYDAQLVAAVFLGTNKGHIYCILNSATSWTSYTLVVDSETIVDHSAGKYAYYVSLSSDGNILGFATQSATLSRFVVYMRSGFSGKWTYRQTFRLHPYHNTPDIVGFHVHDDGKLLYTVREKISDTTYRWSTNLAQAYEIPYKYETSSATSGEISVGSAVTHFVKTAASAGITIALPPDNIVGRTIILDVRGSISELTMTDHDGGAVLRWVNTNVDAGGLFKFTYIDSQYVYIN